MSGPYDDIIHLPHHTSTTHPRMSRENRAAQFSPFAALTGYDAAIAETGRLTNERVELAQGAAAALDAKLALLADMAADHPEVTVTYFRPDEKKQGGAHVAITGMVKRVDDVERTIFLASGEVIPITDILDIESALFKGLEL